MNSKRPLKLYLCITKSNWGGAQKYVYDIATALPRDAFEVTVLLGGKGELADRLTAAGVRVMYLPNSQRDIDTKKDIALFFDLYHIFKKEKPDIVHVNSSKLGGVGALAGRLAGVKKIVFTGHGWAFNEKRPWYQKCTIKWLHVLTILLSHETIAVSQITKHQIPWPFRNKLVVIPNGLRPIQFKTKDEARAFLAEKIKIAAPKTASTLDKHPVWIGTISELHSNKGIAYAIEAIANMQENVLFIVIGEGEERRHLQELIVKLGVAHRICLVGRIEMASEYLKALDIFTLTSITEAFPYAILETGAAGLPIVATAVGGIPEAIINGETGILVSPRHADQIRTALIKLVRKPELGHTLGSHLKEKVESQFPLSEMIRKTVLLYRM